MFQRLESGKPDDPATIKQCRERHSRRRGIIGVGPDSGNRRFTTRATRAWCGNNRRHLLNRRHRKYRNKIEMEPMPVRRKLIAGNWKMNGLRAAGLELAKD